jgi:acyl carrier protein
VIPASRALVPRVERLFREVLAVEPPQPDADLITGGVLDSLALVELLHALELEFSIEIPLDELEVDWFRTIESIATFAEGYGAVETGDAA